jgi:hypothetical protein
MKTIFQKSAKFLLALLSWVPIVWTVVILAAAYSYGYRYPQSFGYAFKSGLRHFLINFAELYTPAGFVIWLVLLVGLSMQKTISARQRNFSVILVLAGILCAALALSYDVFGLQGSYLD